MSRLSRFAPFVCGLLAACHSEPNTGQTATTADALASATPAAPPATTPDSPGAAYRQYRGLLPGTSDTITLDLVTAPRRFGDDEQAASFASYHGADGHPHQLASLPTAAPDSVLLFDAGPELADSQPGGANWRLLRQGRALSGTRNGRLLRLREVLPAVALAVRYLADSVVAFPDVHDSPVAHLSLQTLVANGAPAALNPNILRDLRGDSVSNLPAPQLAILWQEEMARYQKMYREDAAENRQDVRNAAADLPTFYGLRYDEQHATYVLWNHAPLLSLGFYTYSYTGGAHGNYATTTATYNTRTGQRLRFEDIFRPGTDAQLSQLLEKAVRRTLHIPASEPLDGTLFVKTMPVTHNVYLTSTGAVFTYGPYEIASYAQGEIPVFVPLSELQPLLKLPLPA